MNKLNYVEPNIYEKVLNPNSQQEFVDLFPAAYQNFAKERANLIQQLVEEINSGKKIIAIKGVQGIGKTTLTNAAVSLLSSNTYSFYYNCSEVSTLDDIFFSLYTDLCKAPATKDLNKRLDRNTAKLSIDEKIIGILKNFKSPFLFVLDSADYLVQGNNLSDEVLNFMNYLLSLPTSLVVFVSRTKTDSIIDLDEDSKITIRLNNLDVDESQRILAQNNMEVTSHLAAQIYDATRGYPYNLVLFATSVQRLGVSPFELLKDFSTQNVPFNYYFAKRLYSILPSNAKRLLWYLSVARHEISITALNKLVSFENLDELINKLINSMMASQHENGNLCVCDDLKDLIYSLIPDKDKVEMHKFYNNLYAGQLPLKPFERLIKLSRTTINAEKYYHYSTANKLQKNTASNLAKSDISSENYNQYVKKTENIKYVASATPTPDIKEESTPTQENQVEIITSGAEYDIEIDKTQFDVSLSAEEMAMIDSPQEEIKVHNAIIAQEIPVEPVQESSIEELINKAEKYELSNDSSEAIDVYYQAVKKAELENNIALQALLHHRIGINLHRINKLDKCIESFILSKDLYVKKGDTKAIMLVNLSMGRALADNYRHDEAIELFEEVLQSPNHPSNNLMTKAIIEFADVCEYKQNFDKAKELYNRALQNAIEMNSKSNICKIYFKLGLISDDENDVESAMNYYQKCIQVSQDPVINAFLAPVYSNVASVFEEYSQTEKAIEFYEKSLAIDEYTENFNGQYKTASILGNIYFELNQLEKALEYLHKEIKAAKLSKDVYNIATSYLEIGDVYFNIKQYENAIKAYIIARKTIDHTISLDSKEKIERRFKNIIDEVGEAQYKEILQNIRKK